MVIYIFFINKIKNGSNVKKKTHGKRLLMKKTYGQHWPVVNLLLVATLNKKTLLKWILCLGKW